MADYAEVMRALRNADAAGDVESARRLARIAESIRSRSQERGPDPTEGMTDMQKRIAGYGSVAPTLIKGAGNLIRSGLESVGGKGIADTLSLPTSQDIAEMRARDAPLATSGSVEAEPREYSGPSNVQGGRFGVHRGKYAQGIIPGPGGQGIALGNIVNALPLAFAPGANTVLGAGAYGGLYGGIQPAESGEERLQNIVGSATGSAGITAAARALPAIYRAGISPFTESGQNQIALSSIGRFAKDKNALSSASVNELVPGSKPTLAEATGDPGIAQLQRAAQASSSETASMLAANKTDKLQARKDALLSVAGQSGEKEAAEAVRDAAAQRLYSKAWETPIDPKVAKSMKPEIKELLARPSIQDAQKQALKLAKEEGEVLTAKDLNGGSVKGLHYTKKALDDQISEAKRSGNDNLSRLLSATKEKFLGVVDELSPAYKQAREEYATASKPISRMEIGRYLYDKLVPALTDLGAERSTPSAFAKALKEGDEMAKKATGFRGARLADILTSDQQNLLVKLGLDLGREAKALEHAKVPGSPTAQYLTGKNALRQMMGPLGLPEGWAEKTLADTLAGQWISKLGSPAENAVQAKLGHYLANPAEAKAAAARAAIVDKKMIPLSAVARRAVPPIAIGGSAYAAQE